MLQQQQVPKQLLTLFLHSDLILVLPDSDLTIGLQLIQMDSVDVDGSTYLPGEMGSVCRFRRFVLARYLGAENVAGS